MFLLLSTVSTASCSLGAAQASIEQAAEHTKVRKQFDSPLADNQVQQTMNNWFLIFRMSVISVLPVDLFEFVVDLLKKYRKGTNLNQVQNFVTASQWKCNNKYLNFIATNKQSVDCFLAPVTKLHLVYFLLQLLLILQPRQRCLHQCVMQCHFQLTLWKNIFCITWYCGNKKNKI